MRVIIKAFILSDWKTSLKTLISKSGKGGQKTKI